MDKVATGGQIAKENSALAVGQRVSAIAGFLAARGNYDAFKADPVGTLMRYVVQSHSCRCSPCQTIKKHNLQGTQLHRAEVAVTDRLKLK